MQVLQHFNIVNDYNSRYKCHIMFLCLCFLYRCMKLSLFEIGGGFPLQQIILQVYKFILFFFLVVVYFLSHQLIFQQQVEV